MDKETYEKLKLKVDEIFSSGKYNSVGIGPKFTNGKQVQDETCIFFKVDKKLPVNQLRSEDLIPDSFEVNNTTFRTDVIEGTRSKFNVCFPDPAENSDPSTWPNPPKDHRIKQRPLLGGISVSTIPKGGFDYDITDTYRARGTNVGTLGGFAYDYDDNTIVGISNNHVLGQSSIIGKLSDDALINWRDNNTVGAYEWPAAYKLTSSGRSFYYWSFLFKTDTFDTPAGGYTNPGYNINTDEQILIYPYTVYQPGALDLYNNMQSVLSPYYIGMTKKVMPFVYDGPTSNDENRVDCATFSLENTNTNSIYTPLKNENIWKLLGLDAANDQNNTFISWATEEEIDNLPIGLDGGIFNTVCQSSGRTTGPHNEYLSRECETGLYSTYSNNLIDWGANLGMLRFYGCISYIGEDPSAGGDSGMFVLAPFGDDLELKVIGLNFAGGGTTVIDGVTYKDGLGNNISVVAEQMNLGPLTRSNINSSIGLKNKSVKVVEGRRKEKFLLIDGQKYIQAGSTNLEPNVSDDRILPLN